MGSRPSKRKKQISNSNGKPDTADEGDDEDQGSDVSEDVADDAVNEKGKRQVIGRNTDIQKIRNIIEEMMDVLSYSKDFTETGILTKLRQTVKIYFALKRTRKDDLYEVCNIMLNRGLLDIFVRMWDHFHQNSGEFYSNEKSINFRIMKQIKLVLWNYSDKCVELPKAIHKNVEVVKRLMNELTLPELSVDKLKRFELRFMVKATLCILINSVRHCNKIRTQIRKNNGIDTLLAYEKSTFLIIKAEVYILMAYCVTEKENARIVTGSGVIGFIVNLLSSAVSSPNHVAKKYAFSAEETIVALNRLAQNDENKKTIVEAGVLPVFVKLLKDENKTTVEEQYESINCIWTLAFHTDNKDKIINEPDLTDIARRLKQRSELYAIAKLHKACCSLLFILGLEGNPSETELKPQTKTKHIMLSYNWEVQDIMIKLRDYLKQKGYEVWMDVEKMQDSILSAMAEAVENSAIILVAMTESYRNSNSCRTEAEYAYRRQVAILPLLLQPGYVADGWLGAMVGTKLYVDLSSGFHDKKFAEVGQQISGIISAAKSAGNKLAPISSDALVLPNQSTEETSAVASGEGDKIIGLTILQYNLPCAKWSKNDVIQWRKGIGIKDSDSFPVLDGTSLSQLCKMLLRSPDNYYSILRNDFHLSADDVLLMTSAIEALLAK